MSSPTLPRPQWSLVFAFAFFLMGWALTAVPLIELCTFGHAAETPHELTCHQLGLSGPGDNLHVTLTRFTPCWCGYTTLSDENGHWQSAQVPLAPVGPDGRPAGPPGVVVYVGGVHNEAELRQALAGDRLTGVVTSRGRFGESTSLLRQLNPGMDPERCFSLSLSTLPLGPALWYGLAALGLVLFTAAVFLFTFVKPAEQLMYPMNMSPLVLLVRGLHQLADHLPLPDRRVCGLFVFVAAAPLLGWAVPPLASGEALAFETSEGWLFGLGAALDFGVAFAALGLYLLLAPVAPEPPVGEPASP
jgi:hypothetical protein